MDINLNWLISEVIYSNVNTVNYAYDEFNTSDTFDTDTINDIY